MKRRYLIIGVAGVLVAAGLFGEPTREVGHALLPLPQRCQAPTLKYHRLCQLDADALPFRK
jgi:hypothetical protein